MCIVSQFILKLIGWEIAGQLPDEKKYIIILGPHTSNWDFVVAILVRSALKVDVRFLAQRQLVKFPFGWLFRILGGVSPSRDKPYDLVNQVVSMFNLHERFIVGLTPEGTRCCSNRWHSGFYWIAKVDIVMIGLDYYAQEIVIREPFKPSGDIDIDFPIILDYFRGFNGRFSKRIPFHRPDAKS